MFLIEGVNSSPEQVRKIAAQAEKIRPDKIQLNTAVRPTADPGVRALSESELAELCKLFGPKAEVIADFRSPAPANSTSAGSEQVLDMIRRRPVTAQDIASGMGLPLAEALKQAQALRAEGKIVGEKRGEKEYFRPA